MYPACNHWFPGALAPSETSVPGERIRRSLGQGCWTTTNNKSRLWRRRSASVQRPSLGFMVTGLNMIRSSWWTRNSSTRMSLFHHRLLLGTGLQVSTNQSLLTRGERAKRDCKWWSLPAVLNLPQTWILR